MQHDHELSGTLTPTRPKETSHSHELAEADCEEGPPVENENEQEIVTWDGADDAANPKNWSFKRKWGITVLVSLITFMTGISSAIIAPASNVIDDDFKIHSSFQQQLNFSIIQLAYVIGPLALAPLSEIYGRSLILQLSNVFFLIFNLVNGFANSDGEFLAFRFLSGLGACAPLTIGGGVLSDLWRPEEIGMAIGLYTLAPLLSPALGPLLGAWIVEKSTWKWCFFSITIFGVIVQVLVFFTLKETYGPRILQMKAQKLREETGNDQLRTTFELNDLRLVSIMRTSLVRVIVLLTTQPIIIFLSVYFAMVYGIIYLMLSSFPSLWTAYYHESVGVGGLHYVAIMCGLTIGAQGGGRIVDYLYKTLKSRSPDKTGSPEFRVPLLFLSTAVVAVGLFMYGWSAEAKTFWLSADIGAAIFSIGAAMTFTSIQTYVIDSYPLFAASAIGATAVLRSLTGFGFPLFAPTLYDKLGYGWGNSVLGFAVLAVGYAGALILWFYGSRLRDASPYARG
ncbi:uncharacterized protein BHQ10_007304 [Talaromyces amestolkiae]|uniref:Major facilitator superfamily (MFS) profile domain-containing protein n=1 Tax=Talaromyces amestolkiae TaxID=1196081 RepID=A0A364L666_TALAM|nr:uncharacterized protein BHQ10_007304 [Talaromyces amestolkiae]RAO71292.1 hypothetical protein BHQ10_007304 [Talaromyces amestolkiae]